MNDKNEQKITVGGIITLVWFAVSMYAIVQLGMNGEIFLMFLVVGQSKDGVDIGVCPGVVVFLLLTLL